MYLAYTLSEIYFITFSIYLQISSALTYSEGMLIQHIQEDFIGSALYLSLNLSFN